MQKRSTIRLNLFVDYAVLESLYKKTVPVWIKWANEQKKTRGMVHRICVWDQQIILPIINPYDGSWPKPFNIHGRRCGLEPSRVYTVLPFTWPGSCGGQEYIFRIADEI